MVIQLFSTKTYSLTFVIGLEFWIELRNKRVTASIYRKISIEPKWLFQSMKIQYIQNILAWFHAHRAICMPVLNNVPDLAAAHAYQWVSYWSENWKMSTYLVTMNCSIQRHWSLMSEFFVQMKVLLQRLGYWLNACYSLNAKSLWHGKDPYLYNSHTGFYRWAKSLLTCQCFLE